MRKSGLRLALAALLFAGWIGYLAWLAATSTHPIVLARPQFLVADIYAAGETPIEGVTREAVVVGLIEHGHRNVRPLADPSQLASTVRELARPGDMVVCLGAGSITGWANSLPADLAALQSPSRVA